MTLSRFGGLHPLMLVSSSCSLPHPVPKQLWHRDFPHSFGLFDPREWVNPPTINPYFDLFKVSHKNPWNLSGGYRTIVISLFRCNLAYMTRAATRYKRTYCKTQDYITTKKKPINLAKFSYIDGFFLYIHTYTNLKSYIMYAR